mmetsp:Transcript_41497/g.130745  ORF Transcript_41497/g.130745 Transcript_41497/m.130745 type:complete len:202 (-) Transcript_41497:2920-3525(-)
MSDLGTFLRVSRMLLTDGSRPDSRSSTAGSTTSSMVDPSGPLMRASRAAEDLPETFTPSTSRTRSPAAMGTSCRNFSSTTSSPDWFLANEAPTPTLSPVSSILNFSSFPAVGEAVVMLGLRSPSRSSSPLDLLSATDLDDPSLDRRMMVNQVPSCPRIARDRSRAVARNMLCPSISRTLSPTEILLQTWAAPCSANFLITK